MSDYYEELKETLRRQVAVCENSHLSGENIILAINAIDELLTERDFLKAELEAAKVDMKHIADSIDKCTYEVIRDDDNGERDRVCDLHLGRCSVCNDEGECENGAPCNFRWRGRK